MRKYLRCLGDWPTEPELVSIIQRQVLWMIVEPVFCCGAFSWGFAGTGFGFICDFLQPAILAVIFGLSSCLSFDKLIRLRRSTGAALTACVLIAPVLYFVTSMYTDCADLGLKLRVHQLCGRPYLQEWADHILTVPL